MGKQVEIERRFLLKRMPIFEYEGFLDISQCYVEEDKVFTRYRGQKGVEGLKYYRTIKDDIDGSLVREEGEEQITQEEFLKKVQESKKLISKMRYSQKNGEDTWEIDNFKFMHLIIAEIEMPSKDYDLDIPDNIKNEIVMEVTNIKEFNNAYLADSFEKFD